ncbi:MAG: hypothetical protein H6672_20410 [Anaerolineaceae bacterium]|nr:hypothetical protein [Anaerolineaceae bacterium]
MVRWYHYDNYQLQTHRYDAHDGQSAFLEWHIRRYVTAAVFVTLFDETAADELSLTKIIRGHWRKDYPRRETREGAKPRKLIWWWMPVGVVRHP